MKRKILHTKAERLANKKAYQEAWSRANKGYVNAYRGISGYGVIWNVAVKLKVSRAKARQLVEKRKKGCIICRCLKLFRSGRFVIDHDHKTGRAREILCDYHNVLVGYLEKTSEAEMKFARGYLAIAEAINMNADPYDLQPPDLGWLHY
jgi:Recombination endonuclease VII